MDLSFFNKFSLSKFVVNIDDKKKNQTSLNWIKGKKNLNLPNLLLILIKVYK